MNTRKPSYLAAILAGCLLLCAIPAGAQQGYSFIKIADNTTARTDGSNSNFNLSSGTAASFDGQWVVFRDAGIRDDLSLQSIWSYNTQNGKLTKLVSWATVVPGGTTTINDIQLSDTAPIVRSGTVVFLARSNNSSVQGLYSIPAGGGAVTKLADTATISPSGSNFTAFDTVGRPAGGFSFDGATVTFWAQGAVQKAGLYSVRADGTGLALVADVNRPFPWQGGSVEQFTTPAVSGPNVLMLGLDIFSASVYNGIYLGKPGTSGTVIELLNSTQRLPGDLNPAFRTKFDAPVLAFDGSLAAFRAEDTTASKASPFAGLYWTDITKTGTLTKIADLSTALPGLGTLRAIADSGVAVSQGNVLFRAADAVGRSALYLWQNGTFTRMISGGDQLGGQAVQNVADPLPSALSGTSFVFTATTGPGLAPGVWLAKAPSSAATVTLNTVNNAGSYGFSSVAPGEIVTLFGTGLGPVTRQDFQVDSNGNIPAALGSETITFNGVAAPIIYISDKVSSAIVPFEVAGQATAQVLVKYNGVSSAPVTVSVTNTLPGLFSVDYSGSGPGVITYPDYTLNSAQNPAGAGAAIVLWLTGLGPLNPTQPNGFAVRGIVLPTLTYPVTVSIGGSNAQILYQGPAPTLVAGLYQINCIVPGGLPPGTAKVVVTADGRPSQDNLTLAVK